MSNVFYEFISNLIKDDSLLNYEWRSDNTEILFKKKDNDGFDIKVSHDNRFIYIYTDTGFHDQFEVNDSFEEKVIDVMGLVRDMLSKNMRIKEILSSNYPRKWLLQYLENNEWHTENEVGLFIWNYFGKKTERIYCNDILPARDLKE